MERAQPKQVWKSTVSMVFVFLIDRYNLQHIVLVQNRHADTILQHTAHAVLAHSKAVNVLKSTVCTVFF